MDDEYTPRLSAEDVTRILAAEERKWAGYTSQLRWETEQRQGLEDRDVRCARCHQERAKLGYNVCEKCKQHLDAKRAIGVKL